MVQLAGDRSSSGLPQASPGRLTFGNPRNHPKRKPADPRNGSSIENPIEIDAPENPASKRTSRSRRSAPAPALRQSPGGNPGPSSANHFPVTPWKPFLGHPWHGPGGVLPSSLQQYQQAFPETSGYYPQLAQSHTPAAFPGQLMETHPLRQHPYPMTAPAFVQPSLIFRDSPVATAQHFSQDISHPYIQQPKNAPNSWSGKFGPSHPNQISGSIRAANPNYYQKAATGFSDEQFSLRPGICGLPSAGIGFSESLTPSGANRLLYFEPEQIVNGWLEDWESRGLLDPDKMESIFKGHGWRV